MRKEGKVKEDEQTMGERCCGQTDDWTDEWMDDRETERTPLEDKLA